MRKTVAIILILGSVLVARAAYDTVPAPVDLSQYGGILSGYRSMTTGISAAGTTQATATPLTKELNEVTTVASGAGVVLATYTGPGFARQEVVNVGANTLNVYPPTASAAIRNLNGSTSAGAAGAAVTLAVGTHATFECVSATLCYEAP